MVSESIKCANGHDVKHGMNNCPACGASLKPWFCPSGHENAPMFGFCNQCGVPNPLNLRTSRPSGVASGQDNFLDKIVGRAGIPSPQLVASYPLTDGGSRFLAGLIDYVIAAVLGSFTFGLLGLAFLIWVGWINGTGGQSLGYMATGQYLVAESDHSIIGPGRGVGRQFLHVLDNITLGVGYIIGLTTGQTLADRVMRTVVVKKP